jgi:hypothetical protein
MYNKALPHRPMRVRNPDRSPLESTAGPAKLHPAPRSLSAMTSGTSRAVRRFCAPQNNDFFSLRVPEFPLKLNCHASITKRDSFRRLDQVPCDSDCLADHHLSGFDNRLRDVRLAIGSVNRLAGRFAEICSAFKSDTRTISHSHN